MYKLKKIFKNEKGQGMVEYGLILALVSIVAILGLNTLGGNIKGQLEGIADSIGGISEPGQSPGYSDEEIEGLINDGFIPVATAEDLNSVRSAEKRIYAAGTEWETKNEVEGGLDKKYIQVLNIDLSGYSVEGWTPIGDSSAKFRGTYDGGNYVITGLEVKGEGSNFQGLFGYTEGATIRNVGLIDNKVTGENGVGGLVGRAVSSTIENSYATGSVTGTGSYKQDVGGLVGQARENNTISNSYATGAVTAGKYYQNVGGLVGNVHNSTIENSYATGSVTGEYNQVGGLVGWAHGSAKISNSYAIGSVTGKFATGGLVGNTGTSDGTSSISNSYATGSVEGTKSVGGLVGWAHGSAKISNSYAIGSVTGSEDNVGGLLGQAYNNGTTISNSYWDKDTTGQEESARQDASFGKSTDEMKKQTTYLDWEFDTIWKIQEGVSYPTLINNPERH